MLSAYQFEIYTHIYIFFYIFTPFLLVIKPLSYWEQDLETTICVVFFFFKEEIHLKKYSVLVIIWGICAHLFSLNVT